MSEMQNPEWPHPNRCPSSECRGQFLWLRHYGVICSVRLQQLTGGSVARLYELSNEAHINKTEGLGLA
jgi:hypothetical protein